MPTITEIQEAIADRLNVYDAQVKKLESENAELLDRIETIEAKRSDVGFGLSDYQRAVKDFSISRAVGGLLRGESVDCGREREVIQEFEKATGRVNDAQGIWIPDEVFQRKQITTVTDGELMPERHLANEWTDILRPSSYMNRVGVYNLTGLAPGIPVHIPQKATSGGAQWVGETGPVAEQNLSAGEVILTPHAVAGHSAYSARAAQNSAPAVDQLIVDDIMSDMAEAIEAAFLRGDGTGNQPVGLLNAGIPSTTVATPAASDLNDLVTTVSAAGADVASSSFIMSPANTGDFMMEARLASGTENPLTDRRDSMLGFPNAETGHMPNTDIVFGDFRGGSIFASWAGVRLITDPYTRANELIVRVVAHRDVDFGFRRVAQFAGIDGIT